MRHHRVWIAIFSVHKALLSIADAFPVGCFFGPDPFNGHAQVVPKQRDILHPLLVLNWLRIVRHSELIAATTQPENGGRPTSIRPSSVWIRLPVAFRVRQSPEQVPQRELCRYWCGLQPGLSVFRVGRPGALGASVGPC